MGYQLRLHNEIRDWLTRLRVSEPELARRVGEAVVALLDAGESLGPPLVVPLASALRPPDDPREALDLSYQRQLETLTRVRRGVAEVATSRKRAELQAAQLEQSAGELARQHEAAVSAGREELAGEIGGREQEEREQLSELRRHLLVLTAEEKKLTAASQRLTADLDTFRLQKETAKAGYTAAQASQAVHAAWDAIATGGGDLRTPEDHDVSPLPSGLKALRPGAPGHVRVGLLFAMEPQDTAVVTALVEEPGQSPGAYQEVARIAAARLPAAPPGRPSAAAPSSASFTSYLTESFLDEFFPGEETEVEIGADGLLAANRAHTLAEARQRLGLTQVQVATRMSVRQERVSAIERAEPGATEVRTLAAYVRALGGRLEIVADIGGERFILR